jgi:hypothetical protein
LSVCVSSSTAAIGAHSLDCSLGACRQPVNASPELARSIVASRSPSWRSEDDRVAANAEAHCSLLSQRWQSVPIRAIL